MNYDSMISTIYDNMSTSKCLQPEGPSGDPFDVHPAHLYGQGVNAVDLGILRFYVSRATGRVSGFGC